MRFEAAIFDLDGTLIDTLEDLSDALNRVLRRHGYPTRGYGECRRLIGHGIRQLVTDALPAVARAEATIDACCEEMLTDYGAHCLVKTRPYDGVDELVRRLRERRLPLAVYSNKADVFTQRLVTALFPAGAFVVVRGAGPDLPLKPDPRGALLVARRLAAEPAATAYVGDSGIDMTTATRAGMIAVGVTWGFRSREELLDNGAVVLLDHRPSSSA